MSKRTKEALLVKKQSGMRLGRPKGRMSQTTKLTGKDAIIRDYIKRDIPQTVMAKLLQVNRLTLRHYIRTRKLDRSE